MGISLKIKGNKRGNEGVGVDLIAIGDPRFQVIDQQYPGVGSTSDFIVVRHLLDKSVYTIVTKNVTPCDSSRAGVLMISVAVPIGEYVERLFSLLIELSGFYKSNYMTYDGSTYHFTAGAEDASGFEAILSRYNVGHYPYHPVKMSDDTNAIAYLYMTSSQIATLLDDPMRYQFASYGQVVLVPVSDPSAMPSTISVTPEYQRNYKIYVNGRPSAQSVSDPQKTISITIPENKDFESISCRFTLAEARQGMVPGIVADDLAQIIYVKLQAPKKQPVIIPDEHKSHVKDEIAEKPKPKYALIIGIIVALLLIAAGICWYLGIFDKSGSTPNNNSTSEELSDEEAEKLAKDEYREKHKDDGDYDEIQPFEDLDIPEETEAEKIKDEKSGINAENSDKKAAPVKPSTPSQPTAKPDQPADDPNKAMEDAWISQLSSTLSFSMSDLKSIKEAVAALPPNAQTQKINELVQLHQDVIGKLTSNPSPDNNALKEIAANVSVIPPLARKLRDLSTKSPEDIENYCLDLKNRVKRNNAKIY